MKKSGATSAEEFQAGGIEKRPSRAKWPLYACCNVLSMVNIRWYRNAPCTCTYNQKTTCQQPVPPVQSRQPHVAGKCCGTRTLATPTLPIPLDLQCCKNLFTLDVSAIAVDGMIRSVLLYLHGFFKLLAGHGRHQVMSNLAKTEVFDVEDLK